MCGIAGWLDRDRDLTRETETVRRMADTLARRDPMTPGSGPRPGSASDTVGSPSPTPSTANSP